MYKINTHICHSVACSVLRFLLTLYLGDYYALVHTERHHSCNCHGVFIIAQWLKTDFGTRLPESNLVCVTLGNLLNLSVHWLTHLVN